MAYDPQTVVLIPARAGSTRVKNKNIRDLGGKPLVGHTIDAAIASGAGRVIVSTDSEEIAEISRKHGAEVPFLRPAEISTATASTISALLHALRWIRDHDGALPQLIAFCPPTNPFTRPETIAGTAQMLQENDRANSVITIYPPELHPFSFVQKKEDGKLIIDPIQVDGKNANNVERSQDLPTFWLRSGNCSTTRTKFFAEKFGEALDENSSPYIQAFDIDLCLGFEIPADEALDINTPADFELAEISYSCRLNAS